MLCCKKESTKNNGKYSEVSQVEADEDVEEIIIQDEEKKKVPSSLDVEREIQNVCSTIESGQYFSQVANGGGISNDVSPVPPACDDNISINSVESNGNIGNGNINNGNNNRSGYHISNNHYSMNPNVQASIIYEKEKKYVAGKVIQVTGLSFEEKYSPLHIRVHVVVFPVKKYAIKTNWYEIRKDGKIKMDEYFKFVFKQIPSDKRGRIRIRAYVQSTALGMLGKPECIGESYVNLIEILTAGGGKTIWRPLSRDVSSQTIPEE